MFSIEQIKAAHAKVKSGADFPAYIAELKTLGILAYEHYLTDGHINYTGANGFSIDAPAKWAPVEIAATASAEQLKSDLLIHQHGKTDYLTFCKQAAAAGIEKWKVDLLAMTCSYYDKSENSLLVEDIPAV